MKSTKFYCLILLFGLLSLSTNASHIMGGEITYECVGASTYDVKLTLYRDCNGVSLGSTQFLDISTNCSGGTQFQQTLNLTSSGDVTPVCANSAGTTCSFTPGATYGVEEFVYEGTITLPFSGCNNWLLEWSSCCRNSAITTLSFSAGSNFSASLDDNLAVCNNSPQFYFKPIFYGCVGQPLNYSHGVSDADGDSLVFALSNPMENSPPTPISYQTGFSPTNPLSTSAQSFNTSNGDFAFTPSQNQVGVIKMDVLEYRNGQLIGITSRDIQITIGNFCGGNTAPILSGINGTADSTGITGSTDTSVCAGQQICFDISSYAASGNINLFYNNTLPGATFTVDTTGTHPVGTLCWTPPANYSGKYHFGVKVENDQCPLKYENNYNYSINVNNNNAVSYIATPNLVVNYGDTVQIASFTDTSCSVTWSPSVGLSCTNCPFPTVIPTSTTTYYATYNCNTQCGSTFVDSITITVLTPPNQISGIVTRGDGLPLNYSTVTLMDTAYNTIAQTTTDSLGNYSFTTTEDSVYIYAEPDTVNHPDNMLTYFNLSPAIQGAQLIGLSPSTVLNFNTIQVILFTQPIYHQAYGRVEKGIDGPGDPVAEVRIIMTDTFGTVINDDISNINGYVNLGDIEVGTYKFLVDQLGIDNSVAPSLTFDGIPFYPFVGIIFTLHSDYLEAEAHSSDTEEAISEESISLFPNPTNENSFLKYSLNQKSDVSINVMDINGKLVQSHQFTNQIAGDYQYTILKEFLSTGIYFIQLNIGSQSITKKLIITD